MRARVAALAVLFSAAVAAQGIRQVSQSGFGAFEASMVPFGDGFAVAWYDTRDGHAEIYARLLDAAGASAGPELRLTHINRDAYEADIAAAGANLVVAWYEVGPRSEYRAMVGSWTREGRGLWTRQLSVEGRNGKNPVVRVSGQEILCAWLDFTAGGIPEVHAQWFDLSGQPLGPARRVAQAGRTTWNLNAAFDGQGRAWVAFDAKAGTQADELFLARVEKNASQLVRLTSDDGKASKYPDIAFDTGGRAALTWFDERDGNEEVYLFVAPVGEFKEGLESRALRVTDTAGASTGAYLTWNGGRIGLAWNDDTLGQDEIFFETFDVNGQALAPAKRLTDNPSHSLIPAIRPAGDGFALAWNEFSPGPAGGHDPRGRSEVAFTFAR